jgi:tRNA A-37 threonylcarbamoyl transferase component Bud32
MPGPPAKLPPRLGVPPRPAIKPGAAPDPAAISSLADDESSPTFVDPTLRPHVPAPPPSNEEGATLVDPKVRQSLLDLDAQLGALDNGDFDSRYDLGEVLGRGGMGEVRLAKDTRVGRNVAVKLIRPDSAKRPRLRARFLFEAKMQGQLEHPSIVPVYDLGVRPDGSEFFTMRRVRGRTLHEVIRGLRANDRGVAAAFSRRRLVAAFQSVCLAVEFAHQRGVVHRDLKPANVMLGEFGEVIVLDWGLAKLRERDADTPERAALDEARSIDTTAVGEVLGSPGYMSPEQAVDSQSVGTKTDIFALGAILFEILTQRHLVPGDTNAVVTRNTIVGDYDARASKRFPDLDVPPELEAICVQATDKDPARRQERARELADAVERYLEGDRDVARRRSMAGRHTRAAIAALAESVEATSPEVARAARGRAIREVNHALAIAPQSQTALRTMMKIMTEAPAAVAPEAEASFRASEDRALRTVARRGTFAYLALAANVGLMGLLGVVDWVALAVAVGCFLGAAAATLVGSLDVPVSPAGPKPAPGASRLPVGPVVLAVLVLSSCGIAASSMLFGPLVYVPSLAAANVVVFAAGVGRRYRYLALACGLLAILLPLALDLTGVLPAGWVFHDGIISIMPRAVRFPGPATVALLALASVGAVLFPVLLVGAERDARVKAERELVLQSQALAEFVPAEAGEALSSVRRPTWTVPPPGATGG